MLELDGKAGRHRAHELAARALSGQPFGFTAAQLAALRYLYAEDWRGPLADGSADVADRLTLRAAGFELPEDCDDDQEEGRRICALVDLAADGAARVAALLPPDDPAGCFDCFPAWAPARYRRAIPPAMPAETWARILPGCGLLEVDDPAQLPPHELAARALYGQPFGFTRAQLGGLRRIYHGGSWADMYFIGGMEEGAEAYRARGLAASEEGLARLAALLP